MFQTLREPPPKGSLRESILIEYVLRKDLIEHSRLRALATSIINKEKAADIFEEYRKEAFPWVETQKGRDAEATRRLLQQEVDKGPLGVTPLWQANKKIRSRIKTKIVDTAKPLIQRSKEEINRIYEKLGTVRPI